MGCSTAVKGKTENVWLCGSEILAFSLNSQLVSLVNNDNSLNRTPQDYNNYDHPTRSLKISTDSSMTISMQLVCIHLREAKIR